MVAREALKAALLALRSVISAFPMYPHFAVFCIGDSELYNFVHR